MRHISIISLILLLLSLLFGVGCGYNGNGIVKVERREVGSFKSIVVDQDGGGGGFLFGRNERSDFRIKLVKDTVEYTTIEYDENLLHHIKVESVNDKLIIRSQKDLFSKRDIHVNVHYVNLDQIDVHSFADVVFSNPYHGSRLGVDVSGACNIRGEVFADVVDMDISGAADVDLSGKVRKLKGEFSGAGTYKAFGLITDTCILDISGASEAQLHVLHYLKVDVSGAGDVEYRGRPRVDQNISGAGNIRASEKDTL